MTALPCVITVAWLADHGACDEGIEVVARYWPDGAEPTADVLAEAGRAGLDITWLTRWLPAPLRARCNAGVAPLLARYDAEAVLLWARYDAEEAASLARAWREAACPDLVTLACEAPSCPA